MWHFLGIGAQKCGTTWLHRHLARHPELGFPLGKEAHFWDRPFDEAGVRRYLARFTDDPCREGEITPAYGILPDEVVARIHGLAPDLRLIYSIRNPLQRAWSSARMALERAEMRLDEASDQWFLDHFRSQGSLARGDYAACLRNWWKRFPREQLLLLRFKHIADHPEDVLQQCCAHLGVSPPDPAVLEGCRESAFSGSGAPLRPALHDALEALYRPRIAALEDLLGEDFGTWLQGNP